MKSIKFDGSSDFLVVDAKDFEFGKEDFTISAYVNGDFVDLMPRDPFILKDCIREVLRREAGEQPLNEIQEEQMPHEIRLPAPLKNGEWCHISVTRKGSI